MVDNRPTAEPESHAPLLTLSNFLKLLKDSQDRPYTVAEDGYYALYSKYKHKEE